MLVLLHKGPRAGELVNLRVRDLDDDGKLLWIRDHIHGRVSHLRTDAAKRAIRIPAFLQLLLIELAAGRRGDDYLFGKHYRDWPREQTQRICEAVAVPKVTAHGLRGMKATLALIAEEDPDTVARSLGHTSSKITIDAYAAPGTREHIEHRRLERSLLGSPVAQEKRQTGESTSNDGLALAPNQTKPDRGF